MRYRTKTLWFVSILTVGVSLSLAEAGQAQSSVACDVKPTAKVMAMAQNPQPPADARQATAAGDDKLAVNTANDADDVDMVWAEEIDIDGDGKVEDTQILYDSEDGVLYFYAEEDVPCADGGTATADLLMCIYCEGNAADKPVGSGWCVVELDAGECGAQAAGIYGCRFDAKGVPTAFAAVTIDEKNDEIVIVAAERDR